MLIKIYIYISIIVRIIAVKLFCQAFMLQSFFLGADIPGVPPVLAPGPPFLPVSPVPVGSVGIENSDTRA